MHFCIHVRLGGKVVESKISSIATGLETFSSSGQKRGGVVGKINLPLLQSNLSSIRADLNWVERGRTDPTHTFIYIIIILCILALLSVTFTLLLQANKFGWIELRRGATDTLQYNRIEKRRKAYCHFFQVHCCCLSKAKCIELRIINKPGDGRGRGVRALSQTSGPLFICFISTLLYSFFYFIGRWTLECRQ